MVDCLLAISLKPQFIGEWYPVAELLLHESVGVDSEPLQLDKEELGERGDFDLLCRHLVRQACLTQEFVVLIQQFLGGEPLHAVG